METAHASVEQRGRVGRSAQTWPTSPVAEAATVVPLQDDMHRSLGVGFGHDFASIPVHSDPAGNVAAFAPSAEPKSPWAETAARQAGAVASPGLPVGGLTVPGREMSRVAIARTLLGAGSPGHPVPEGMRGRFEKRTGGSVLTHTVQQRATFAGPQMQPDEGEPADLAEQEADTVADTVLDEFEDEDVMALSISAQPAMIATAPKGKKKKRSTATSKPAKPKPIKFMLFAETFTATVDAKTHMVTARVAKKSDWTFTATAPNTVEASRTPNHAEYVHAGGATEPLVEKTTIHVPDGGPATVDPIVAVLNDPPTLTIALSGPKRAAHTTSRTINGAAAEQLVLPPAALTFTPADGDAIHLSVGGDAWVFTTLKQDPTPPATATTDVKGFFKVGYFTRYNDRGTPTFGTATPTKPEASRQQAIEDLADPSTPAARRITAAEADAFKTVSVIESDFAGVQTYDTGILSFGFAQWTINADLPRLLLKVDAAAFERHLGRYGLAVAAPVRQLDAFVAKFVPTNRSKLGVRNASEGAVFLNGHELVNKRLLAKAGTQAPALAALASRALVLKEKVIAAQPGLASKDAAVKAAAAAAITAAKTGLTTLHKSLQGLPGLKKEPDPAKHADILETVATKAHDAAQEVVDNCADSEVMRGSEWTLRFELLGQDTGGQDAQVAQARETFNKVKAMKTHGATFAMLLPGTKGQAALLSSYFNNQAGTTAGMSRAVEKFKNMEKNKAKAAAAKAKAPVPSPTEADWTAFPWKATDTRWTTLWPGVTDDFEEIAVIEVTSRTTDPKRRRAILGGLFP